MIVAPWLIINELENVADAAKTEAALTVKLSDAESPRVVLPLELISTTDYAGPYKTLKKAREMFKKLVCKDKFLNHWDFMIRGPLHKIVRTPTYSHSTVYYNFKERD